jgi:hypothetical protein
MAFNVHPHRKSEQKLIKDIVPFCVLASSSLYVTRRCRLMSHVKLILANEAPTHL